MHLDRKYIFFFNKFGNKGLIGITLSNILISYVTYKTLKLVIKNDIKNYQELLKNILPNKLKENKIFSHTINNIINIFLLISFNIMVAGFATYFLQELNISKWIGAIIIAYLTLIILSKDINGVIKINTFLIPMLIFLIVFLGLNKIECKEIVSIVQNNESLHWLLSSILYASYNSITLIPILIGMKKQIKVKKEAIFVSTFTLISMLLLSITIFLLMNTFINEINGIEIPIVYIANTLGISFKYIYGIVILIAIFTTAIGASFGFLSNIAKTKKSYMIYSVIICILSVFVGQIGFSSLINLLYPIFGYLGIVQIIFLLIR